MVSRHILYVANCLLFSAYLAACELVIGGPGQAIIRPPEAGVEDADPSEASSEAAIAQNSGTEASAADQAPPREDAGRPCVASPPCLEAQRLCLHDCMVQLGDCLGGPNGKGKKCQSHFIDCQAACESTCAECVGCPEAASACVIP
jgi:hypothetical protein